MSTTGHRSSKQLRISRLDDIPTILSSNAKEKKRTPATISEQGYKHLKELGRGGMGKVLLVKDEALSRKIAMKVALARCQSDQELLKRFFTESKITAQLDHPSIPPVHATGVDNDGNYYFTMKYVQGLDLDSIIDALQDGSVEIVKEYTLTHLLNIFLRVCEALAFAHDKNVIHRDLKPENIMIGKFGQVFVMDWGLAKVLGTKETLKKGAISADPMLSTDGTILGTPSYMSPEQANGEIEKVDELSDIYSLGVILYEILTLERAFEGATTHEILFKVLQGNFKRPRKRTPERKISKELESICLKAMSPSRRKRYQTVADLIQDIQSYLEHRKVSSYKYGLYERTVRWVQRHPTVSISIVIAFVLASIGSIVGGSFWQKAQEESSKRRIEELKSKNIAIEKKLAESERDTLKKTAEKHREAETLLSTIQYIPAGPNFDSSVLELLNKAVELSPSFWKVYLEITKHHLHCDRFQEALIAAEKASTLHKKEFGQDSAEIWFHAGIYLGLPTELGGKNRFEEALEYLQKSYEIDSKSLYGQLSKIVIFIINSKKSNSLDESELREVIDLIESLAVDPISKSVKFVWLTRAWVYGISSFVCYRESPLKVVSDLEKAEESLENLYKTNLDLSIPVLNFYGTVLLLRDKNAQAFRIFSRCLEKGKSSQLYYNRALARAKQAQYEEAIVDFEHSLALDSKFSYALINAAKCYAFLLQNISDSDIRRNIFVEKMIGLLERYLSLEPKKVLEIKKEPVFRNFIRLEVFQELLKKYE